jgi:hypothetical protein
MIETPVEDAALPILKGGVDTLMKLFIHYHIYNKLGILFIEISS